MICHNWICGCKNSEAAFGSLDNRNPNESAKLCNFSFDRIEFDRNRHTIGKVKIGESSLYGCTQKVENLSHFASEGGGVSLDGKFKEIGWRIIRSARIHEVVIFSKA